MLNRVKSASQKVIGLRNLKKLEHLSVHDVAPARDYIANYWEKLKRYQPKDEDSLIGLPNPFLVPAYEEGLEFDFNEMYYWDSYFMVQGMYDAENRDLVVGILENLLSLYQRYKIIPNASRTYLMGRSQPPFLTTFIWEVYEAFNMDDKWLEHAMNVAIDEYHTVWMGKSKPNWRQVYHGLSRYYDINMLHDLAEAESGWDMTPRYGRKCLNYLPVDLNALLYKYEVDIARFYRAIGKKREFSMWTTAAEHRRNNMDRLMWDKMRGLYYDYNFVKHRRGNVGSLAAFFPMWAGMVNEKQAAQLVRSLKRFEQPGGLSTTEMQALKQYVPGSLPTQWAYPNGWPPLQYIVIKALQRYGYDHDAERLTTKWLRTNTAWFYKHGVFLEKYNVASPEKPPVKGLYPSQTGFGWTNAIYERLCQDFIDNGKQ
jgi:alpha,alpha-trehalase